MLFTSEKLREDIEEGELLTVCTVSAANVVNDIRENLRNLVGGEMAHYQTLIQQTLDRALERLEEKAKSKGYDGVLSIRISHPQVVEGGVEVIVYGNGFKYKSSR